MKAIIKYLITFIRDEKNPLFYIIMLVFMGLCFYVNYWFDFERKYIESTFGTGEYFWRRLLSYSFPYYLTAIIYAVCFKNYSFLGKWQFWLRSMFALALLCWSCSVNIYAIYITKNASPETQNYFWKLFVNSNRLFTVILPLGLYYIFIDKQKSNFYGFKLRGFNIKPYVLMLCIMFPLIAWASFQPDFMMAYPTYHPGSAETALGRPAWQTAGLYEVIYGLDFITIEFLYRGFLVIGMIGIMGRAAIFPMVATYAFLHFGKPMAEALGSIAGGFILGVIAYYTRSIVGGIMIHVGVALGMDLAAYLQMFYGKYKIR